MQHHTDSAMQWIIMLMAWPTFCTHDEVKAEQQQPQFCLQKPSNLL